MSDMNSYPAPSQRFARSLAVRTVGLLSESESRSHFSPKEAPPKPASTPRTARIPLWLKIAYTLFMAVLVPVYWVKYGPTNFLYFCDVALFLTLAGLWTENRLLVSLPAVGILLPQALWCADFGAQLVGTQLTGMTAYMFDANRSLFLRGLSLFHGWLPFLLVFAVRRVGYDRRALAVWTGLAWALCVICFTCLPPAGPEFAGKLTPNNVNYVWGFDDARPQAWMPPLAYLAAWMGALFALAYVPVHFALRAWAPAISPAMADATKAPVTA